MSSSPEDGQPKVDYHIGSRVSNRIHCAHSLYTREKRLISDLTLPYPCYVEHAIQRPTSWRTWFAYFLLSSSMRACSGEHRIERGVKGILSFNMDKINMRSWVESNGDESMSSSCSCRGKPQGFYLLPQSRPRLSSVARSRHGLRLFNVQRPAAAPYSRTPS